MSWSGSQLNNFTIAPNIYFLWNLCIISGTVSKSSIFTIANAVYLGVGG